MKNWKNWLFPILTCLTVAALALLPPRLSTLRDAQLTGAVHAEPLSEDSNFPFKPPELPERIRLFSQYRISPDRVVLMEQRLEKESEDWRNAVGMAGAELDALYGAGILPFQIEEPYPDPSVVRLYLRDPEDLSSAGFLLMSASAKETGFYLDLVLDIETGKALAVDLSANKDCSFDAPALELGKAVLDRLGLEYIPGEDHNAAASFRLPECGSEFWMLNESGRWLDFSFQSDWSAADAQTAEAYGYSVSAADADPMRKW